jgi:hypothetical protein
MNEERVQAGIQAAADELATSGKEIGLQVAVIKNGRVVADVAPAPRSPPRYARYSGLLAGPEIAFAS